VHPDLEGSDVTQRGHHLPGLVAADLDEQAAAASELPHGCLNGPHEAPTR
jgi:hypothetical protein